MVGVAGLEPATSASRTLRATNCATPRGCKHKPRLLFGFFRAVYQINVADLWNGQGIDEEKYHEPNLVAIASTRIHSY